jgi:hypothetical protein
MLAVGAILCVGLAAAVAQDPAEDVGRKTAEDWLVDFFHYLEIGRWDLAAASGQKFLDAQPAPDKVYAMFTTGKFERKFGSLNMGLTVHQPADGSTKTVSQICHAIKRLWNRGHEMQAFELPAIRAAIALLGKGERAYREGRDRLRLGGLYAVPVLIGDLANPTQADMHAPIARVLGDLDRPTVVQPMTAALSSPNEKLKLALIRALRRLGFSHARAALQVEAQNAANSAAVRLAAADAVARLSVSRADANKSAAALYLELAAQYYAEDPALRGDDRRDPTWVYSWDATAGRLVGRKCSISIYQAVMAQRAAERALALRKSDEAVGLWLSAVGMKDSIKAKATAAGASATVADPGLQSGQGDARYYYLASGQKYLFRVLARALSGEKLDVALRAVEALQNVGTPAGLSSADSGALSRALAYPNRRLRIHAAFAAARINPARGFAASDQVVPVLGEALGQTGQRTAGLVLADDTARNKLKADLQTAGLDCYAAADLPGALTQLAVKPGVDCFLMGEQAAETGYREIRRHPRYSQATVVLLVPAGRLNRYATMLAEDKNLAVMILDARTQADAIVQTYRKTESAAGRSPLDPADARKLALRAAACLQRIGEAAKGVFDAADALPALVDVLNSKRAAELREAAGDVLALLKSANAQQALARVGLDTAEDKAMRIVALNLLGDSFRRFGVLVDAASVAALVKLASEEADLAVRTAAGKAMGSGNLSADKVSELILKFAQ